MNEDPIVEEVRAIRVQLWRKWNALPGGVAQGQREALALWKGRVVTKPFHPEWCSPRRMALAEESEPYGTADRKKTGAP